jgi:hypothetical protein
VTERGVAENQGLSEKVDKLAEQVAQLAQQVAALAGGRPIRNARQAEMSAVKEYGDEGPMNAQSASTASWKDRWQSWTMMPQAEQGGPLLGGFAALAEKGDSER